MSTPDRRARDTDRDDAIELVEAAWVDGQIVEADRDKRVEELLRAQTLAEVRQHTHDLQRPAAPTPARPPTRRVGVVVGVLVALLAVAGAGGLALFAAVAPSGEEAVGSSREADAAAPLPGEEAADGVNVLSRRGYEELVSDLRTATGSSSAFEVALYPDYAVVSMPVDDRSQREARWYWNGEVRDLEAPGTSTHSRFDLDRVDVDVVVRLVQRARRMVEQPDTFYAIVRGPAPGDGAAIRAYASNEYRESAFVVATLQGAVIHSSRR